MSVLRLRLSYLCAFGEWHWTPQTFGGNACQYTHFTRRKNKRDGAERAEWPGPASRWAMHRRSFSRKLLPPPFPQLSEDIERMRPARPRCRSLISIKHADAKNILSTQPVHHFTDEKADESLRGGQAPEIRRPVGVKIGVVALDQSVTMKHCLWVSVRVFSGHSCPHAEQQGSRSGLAPGILASSLTRR